MAKMYIVARDSLDTTQSYITDLTPYEYRVVDIPIVEYEGTAKDFSWNGPWASDLFLNDIQESAFISLKEGQSIANMTDYWRVNYGGGYTVSYQWYSNGKYVSNTTSVVMSGNWTFQYKPSYSAYSIIGDNTRDGGSQIIRPDHNKDGTYISALYDFVEVGSPTVVHLDLKDWLTGWLYGMVGRRLFIKKKSDEIVTPDTAGMCLYGTPSETGNIGLRNGDTVTMYDGWVMPALPQWDKTVYPYACIWGHPVEREFSVLDCTKSPLHFEYTRKYIEDNSFSTPLTLPNNGTAVPHISFLTTTNGVKVPATKADEFTPSRNGAESVLPNGLRITLPVVWSNYNFCYSDGELYVPKSKPIPVNLVGHNYNGVVLSPEFEDVIGNPNYVPPNVSTEFPYWVLSPIYVGGLLFFYEMRMFSRPVIVDGNDIITADGATVDFLLYEEGRGCSLGEGHPSDWNFAHHSSSNRITVGGIKWANFDLLNKDGSIYIAKSDAIPIYE